MYLTVAVTVVDIQVGINWNKRGWALNGAFFLTHTHTLISIWCVVMGAGDIWHVSLPGGGALSGLRAVRDGLQNAMPGRVSPCYL